MRILIFLLVFPCSIYSQNITRNVLSSLNNVQVANSVILHSSFGQSSNAGTISGNNGILRQGFQQPIIDVVTNLEEYYNSNNAELRIYPNPFREMANISVITKKYEGYVLTLRTISGVVVWARQNISAETILPKGGLKPAIYILELKKEEDVIRRNLVVQ